MTQITTRPARPHDVQRLHEMIHALAYFHGDLPRLTLQTLEKTLFGTAPDLNAIVAQHNDRLVGYAVMFPVFKLQFGTHGKELHHMFVEADIRGQGVGRLLIEASVKYANSCGCSHLSVGTHPDNITAQDMYVASGFEAVSIAGPRFRMLLE